MSIGRVPMVPPLSGKLSIAWHKKTVPRLGLQDPVQLEPEYLRLISLNVGKTW
jgi:hypothetical protein